MSITELKEKLENNACHIHKQLPVMAILENGNLKINTCCLLFKSQLHLLAGEQDEKHIDNSPVL